MLDDAMIARLLQTHDNLPAAGQALIAAANEAGGKDNIAVILVRVAGGQMGAARPWWKFGR
jgi:protein phosphatase